MNERMMRKQQADLLKLDDLQIQYRGSEIRDIPGAVKRNCMEADLIKGRSLQEIVTEVPGCGELEIRITRMNSLQIPEVIISEYRIASMGFEGDLDVALQIFSRLAGKRASVGGIDIARDYLDQDYLIWALKEQQDGVRWIDLCDLQYHGQDHVKWQEPGGVLQLKRTSMKAGDEIYMQKVEVLSLRQEYEKLKEILATVTILPVDYWYQQQELYIGQQLNAE